MFRKLPPVFKNFYFIVGVIFIIWMLFIDSNDLYSQFKKRGKLRELEQQKAYYTQMIKEVEKDREELLSNNELLEKFAREKYLMKKESEDLYILVVEEE
jgi:cell division protein FtsB